LRTEINLKLKNIFSTLFFVDEDQITPESSQDSIENWDSMQHLNLVTAIEDEFKCSFEEEDIVQMLNFQLIATIVEEKIL